MFKTLQSVSALISGDDCEAFLHFEVDWVDFEDAGSDGGVEDEEALFEGGRAFLDTVPDNFLNPHLDSFPPAKSWKEVKPLDILIRGLFLQPILQLNKIHWLATQIMTKPLLAYRVILEPRILFLGLDLLVVDYLHLVDVVRVWGGGWLTHQVQELVDVWDVFCYQGNVLLERVGLQAGERVGLCVGWVLCWLWALFLYDLVAPLSWWVRFIPIGKKPALLPTHLFLFPVPGHFLHQSLCHLGLILPQNWIVLVKWTVKHHLLLWLWVCSLMRVKVYRCLRYSSVAGFEPVKWRLFSLVELLRCDTRQEALVIQLGLSERWGCFLQDLGGLVLLAFTSITQKLLHRWVEIDIEHRRLVGYKWAFEGWHWVTVNAFFVESAFEVFGGELFAFIFGFVFWLRHAIFSLYFLKSVTYLLINQLNDRYEWMNDKEIKVLLIDWCYKLRSVVQIYNGIHLS